MEILIENKKLKTIKEKEQIMNNNNKNNSVKTSLNILKAYNPL